MSNLSEAIELYVLRAIDAAGHPNSTEAWNARGEASCRLTEAIEELEEKATTALTLTHEARGL